jgi:hypothetical protein
VEPDYTNIIDSAFIRRMNRLQKFGLSTAISSLQRVNKAIDAVIFATGRGCIDSTCKFLERMFNREGLPVNPAVFIQSTHNTIAAQTAIYLKSKAYNTTITDNQLPFELALDNALICLHDNDFENILLGACDEITPQLLDILDRISKFGKPEIYGEGGACFILSTDSTDSIAEIKYFNSVPADEAAATVGILSAEYAVDYIFTAGKRKYAEDIPHIRYTDYFGNFPTSAACGFWLAVDCLNSRNPAISRAGNILLVAENRQGAAFVTAVGK